MILELTCGCGVEGNWEAEALADIRAAVAGAGWDIAGPLCPDHADPEPEPLSPEVRRLAALSYLVVACRELEIEADEEWDEFEYARAIYRRLTGKEGR